MTPQRKKTLPERLDKFAQTWIANPAARLEFALLVREVYNGQNNGVLQWVEDEHRVARSLGIL